MRETYIKDDKIIPLASRRPAATYPALARVESYWEGLRDGRLMPGRAEVDPRGLADALEHAFILEKVAPGLARFRIAGMALNELMAMEVRGMPLTAMFQPAARREMQRVIGAVLDTPAAVQLSLAGEGGLLRRGPEGRMLLLPLRDHTGAPTRILGTLETLGPVPRHPCRFEISDIETRPLVGAAQFVNPAVAPAPMATVEHRSGADRTEPRPEGHNHLRLVYSAEET